MDKLRSWALLKKLFIYIPAIFLIFIVAFWKLVYMLSAGRRYEYVKGYNPRQNIAYCTARNLRDFLNSDVIAKVLFAKPLWILTMKTRLAWVELKSLSKQSFRFPLRSHDLWRERVNSNVCHRFLFHQGTTSNAQATTQVYIIPHGCQNPYFMYC